MSTPPAENPNMDVEVVSQQMALVSNILAAYTFIADQPERTALVFLGGVCIGLFVTLCAIVFQIHCRADCHYGNSNRPHHHHGQGHRHRHGQHRHLTGGNPDNTTVVVSGGRGQADNESEDWEDTTSDMSARRRRRFERALLHTSVFTSAEELDRAQRLEERERILHEIWMNGQPDISTVTQSLNKYY
ncbi:LOW QUALITY PROTEIN: protein eva-1 homolog A [Lampris incognitus]|uniref:LOW QUALITY PROTEIN: protein eva-1 homolog A n=1 Tax=Lampris incognitus TaxID=2546036 RepID=UPI0024B5197E|nr:LOW QUALITY PROTEIN: protein eva-1 homolog A [Lampris incognitus]